MEQLQILFDAVYQVHFSKEFSVNFAIIPQPPDSGDWVAEIIALRTVSEGLNLGFDWAQRLRVVVPGGGGLNRRRRNGRIIWQNTEVD
jgi:hypothetical protein